MALQYLQPPTECRLAFEAALKHLVDLKRIPDGLKVYADCQPVHIIPRKQVADGNFAAPEQPASWRFYAGDPSGVVVCGEVTATNPPRVSGLSHGEGPKKAMQTMQGLSSRPDTQAGDYNVRVLRVPGGLIEGFWLKPPTDAYGRIVLLKPALLSTSNLPPPPARTGGPEGPAGGPDAETVLDLGALLEQLRPIAIEALKNSNKPRG
jgi:hypothetical protein